jgi:trans-2,3-dihydro-3-hydroxyanthranilate isomerase
MMSKTEYRTLPFVLVDVFTREPLSGNGLSIFLHDAPISTRAMQRITQEMRQFESIFLQRVGDTNRFDTRIFTMEQELPFAGHPIIGAAAYLHHALSPRQAAGQFIFATPRHLIETSTSYADGVLVAEMDQGEAEIHAPVPRERYYAVLEALNLLTTDIAPGLPMQVISTGLPYLIVPLQSGLERAAIVDREFESLLANVGAQFVYVLDVKNREGRTWDNDGRVEDIATGSAAGPAAAYLVKHGMAVAGQTIVLKQGRFLGRHSELQVEISGSESLSAKVRGQVCIIGGGNLSLPESHLV